MRELISEEKKYVTKMYHDTRFKRRNKTANVS